MPTKRVQKGITRFDVDERGTHGFMVRIARRDEKYNQFFSDREYKGKRKALDAAKKCYKEWESELPPPATSKNVKSARNKSGTVGVHLSITPSQTWSNVNYTSYVASWKLSDGRRKKISFSVEKYGKKVAFELATIARDNEIADRSRVEKIRNREKKRSKK